MYFPRISNWGTFHAMPVMTFKGHESSPVAYDAILDDNYQSINQSINQSLFQAEAHRTINKENANTENRREQTHRRIQLKKSNYD